MHFSGPTLLPESEAFSVSPSLQAQKLFYYIISVGDFVCTEKYLTQRDRFDSVQLMEITEGTLAVETGGKTYRAHAGDIVFLDCYAPHKFWTEELTKMRWLHFDGSQTRGFLEVIVKAMTPVFPARNSSVVTSVLDTLLTAFRTGETLTESEVSSLLHTMLCQLVSLSSQSSVLIARSNAVRGSVDYIQNNFGRKLTIAEIADAVSVSPSYFTKLFRQETGMSPYEYLTNIRLSNAKMLLKETNLSIAKIAERTGFSSQSNFIYTFHQKIGMSPAKFRNAGF